MDGSGKHFAVMLMLFIPVLLGVTGTKESDLKNIPGKLVFYQMEGNDTYVRDGRELASDVPTETTFELFDPHKNFTFTNFTYTWDLGNGEVIRGSEPAVRYHYPESGNYTLRLKVGANETQYAPSVTEVYSTDVQVLDAIKRMELKEPAQYEMWQDTSLSFQVDGSPPMWACWRFLHNCEPDMTEGCTLTMLYDKMLELNHTFTSAGLYCLNVSLRNDISELQTSFSLYVRRNNSSQIFFILSSAAIVAATLSFITVIACRSHRHNKAKIAASSNAVFMKLQDAGGQGSILFNLSNMERAEKEPLLSHLGTHCRS